MHQSPDDIFAAHFWSWPDPALKRDAQGRVLFVNAAFLQLFGGQVENWRGQTVQGWHAPQPGPTPARFELRTPASPHLPEQVYDWMELCGPDGSAFALARNVTAFASVAPPPDAPAEMPAQNAPAQPASASRQPVDAAPAYDAQQAPQQTPAEPDPETMAAPAIAAPVIEAPAPAASAATAAPQPVAQPAAQAAPAPTAAPEPAAPAAAAPSLDVPTIDVPELDVPNITAAPAEASKERATERAYERRALPIENDDAVLGNNWRDAVIAKAVGAVDPSADDKTSGESTATDATSGAPEAGASGPNGPIRILLAEDNAINALLTRTLLEAEGHTVETVEDGQLAVEAMKTSSFDMIFMDMRMPNMDGLESTRKIRALPNVSSDLPIVALTANAFDDDRNACFDSGMNDFMTKPVSAEELSEMVARWASVDQKAMAS